jgi:hypothetical protein
VIIGSTGGVWRIELVNDGLQFWIAVLVRMLANEVDGFPIVIGGLLAVGAGFVDHPQAVVAMLDIGKAHPELASGPFTSSARKVAAIGSIVIL